MLIMSFKFDEKVHNSLLSKSWSYCLRVEKAHTHTYIISGIFGVMEILALLVDDKNTPK